MLAEKLRMLLLIAAAPVRVPALLNTAVNCPEMLDVPVLLCVNPTVLPLKADAPVMVAVTWATPIMGLEIVADDALVTE